MKPGQKKGPAVSIASDTRAFDPSARERNPRDRQMIRTPRSKFVESTPNGAFVTDKKAQVSGTFIIERIAERRAV